MIENSVPAPVEVATSREDRAMILFESFGERIAHVEADLYSVPSQDGERTYEVRYGRGVEECGCPDYAYRTSTCVHLLAVGILHARRRGDRTRRILQEAVERFNHELLPDEERMVLLDRIKRLRRVIGD